MTAGRDLRGRACTEAGNGKISISRWSLGLGKRESGCSLERSGYGLENGLWNRGMEGGQRWAAVVVLGGGDQYGDGRERHGGKY